MNNVTNFPDKFASENMMLQDLNDLIQKYNGKMTNVAMLGCLQATANFIFLSIAEQAIESEDLH
jgi:Pyruvate/2-oxoacid:ferredoxin oxidoreductase gamma subunit